AERKSFKAFVLFSLLWSTIVYSLLAHWVWGGGWLYKVGAIDFAGGTVIHITSGVAALVTAIVLGKRKSFGTADADPHNLTLTVLGAGLLWFGWFGFNAGSALAANGQAASAFVTTNIATAAAALAWMSFSWWRHGHPSVLGAAAGAVAGLVAITPACGFVGPMAAIVIGLVAGIVCPFALDFVKERLQIDDALDVFAVHGVGGIWGALATGLFAEKKFGGVDGLFFGRPEQLWYQVVAVAAAIVVSGVGTFIILKLVNLVFPLRVEESEEVLGLDASVHGEAAYQL
ncbi:MAG TPA: ammonium transporter, partial [Thermomicrobiales bacterium]|nr:ammonium transporter [Thermomicrobiales bacterium]